MTTARLVGRRPEPSDADAYVGFYGDPRTPEELWPSDLRTPGHARATLEEFIEHWQRWGFGVWTVMLPGGEVIGHAGVQHTTIDDRPEVELLWFIHPDHWNRGYTTELAREAVRVAFDVLGLDDVISLTVHGNAASRAVMAKLGMTYEGDIEHAGLPHVLDRLTRAPRNASDHPESGPLSLPVANAFSTSSPVAAAICGVVLECFREVDENLRLG